MDRLVIKCRACGALVVVNPRSKTRRCARCNTVNKVEETVVAGSMDYKKALKFVESASDRPGMEETRGRKTIRRTTPRKEISENMSDKKID